MKTYLLNEDLYEISGDEIHLFIPNTEDYFEFKGYFFDEIERNAIYYDTPFGEESCDIKYRQFEMKSIEFNEGVFELGCDLFCRVEEIINELLKKKYKCL